MRHRRQSGVTLVELMVVVVIIGAVVALAVPNLLEWQSNERVKSAARAAADAFALARSEALRTGNNHMVVFANALGAPAPIVVVNDGPPATANCTIEAGEIIYTVQAEPDVSWGTSTAAANGAPVPGDPGGDTTNAGYGWSFVDADPVPGPASWVLFQSDGLPRTFTQTGSTCSAIGDVGDGGGTIYVTNGDRDYAAVLLPMGTSRVHRWEPDGSWSN